MKRILLALVLLLASASYAQAQAPASGPPQPKQFIYVLRPVPRLLQEKNWTERDNQVAQAHFARRRRLTEEGTVILAGRTMNLDSTTFGIVIFEAASAEEARRVMEEDPGVKEGIMTAEVFPYQVALRRREKQR